MIGNLMLPSMLNLQADSATVRQSMGNGAKVNVLQLATHWHATRQATELEAHWTQRLADDMRGGLAFGSKVGGQNQLFNFAFGHTVKQFFEANVLGANAIERAQAAHQYKI